jgi:hypothetical protein
MNDRKRWEIAWALFQAYMRNLPAFFDEERIKQYHAMVLDLESSSGLFLSEFKVPPEAIKPKILGSRRGGYGGRPGGVQYSTKKYCETNYVVHKIEALYKYLCDWEAKNNKGEKPGEDKDYWSMSNEDLERLANKYHIAPWGRAGKEGEHWFVDRTRIINELVKRDVALSAGQPPPTSSTINVGEMHGSVIQQGSPGSSATINFQTNDSRIENILKLVREAALQSKELTSSAREQLNIDVGTIEIQVSATHPKHAIIVESLRSIRSIFEGTTGSLIASGIIFEIAKLLGAN